MSDISKIVWMKNGRILRQIADTTVIIPELPKKIYIMKYSMEQGIYLEEYEDEFKFDFKIYGMETKLIEHIMKTYENTTSNLGLLFNGIKGTGKTVTAKLIANKMNLPVILINEPLPAMADFIGQIDCECILFFDEFEKNFNTNKGSDIVILSVMDGVFNSNKRKVFMLTTNSMNINPNFIGRPSRIRYNKTFGNLQPEVVNEFIDDHLKYPEYKQEITDFLDTLKISTIDILKSIVDEVNIHNKSINTFKNYLNLEYGSFRYSFYYTDKKVTYEEFEEAYENRFNELKQSNSYIDPINDLKNIIEPMVASYLNNEEYPIVMDKSFKQEKQIVYLQIGNIDLPVNIRKLRKGMPFGCYGFVIKTVDENGMLKTYDESYQKEYTIKIINMDYTPAQDRIENNVYEKDEIDFFDKPCSSVLDWNESPFGAHPAYNKKMIKKY